MFQYSFHLLSRIFALSTSTFNNYFSIVIGETIRQMIFLYRNGIHALHRIAFIAKEVGMHALMGDRDMERKLYQVIFNNDPVDDVVLFKRFEGSVQGSSVVVSFKCSFDLIF